MTAGIGQKLNDLSTLYAPTKMEVYGQKFGPPEPPPAGAAPEQNGQMQQMQQDIWRLNMMQLPQNTGGAQLDIYGNGQGGQVDPAIAQQRLQQVYANRPDLIWPGMNPNGTIQMNFTGDRYDR
jgi:hypothetical protein